MSILRSGSRSIAMGMTSETSNADLKNSMTHF